MALRSSPKELGPNARCRDCFLTAQGWMFGVVLDSPKLNLGIFFEQSGPKITGLLWVVSGLILDQNWSMCIFWVLLLK